MKLEKVFVAITAVALLVMCAGIAQEATSVNVVGFTRVTVPGSGGWVMAAVPFDPSAGVVTDLETVFGTNQLTQHTFPTLADRVYLWNGVGYDIFYQRPGGAFYLGGAASNPPVQAGDAFWIRSPSGDSDKEVVFKGQVVAVATQQLDMVAEFQMIGNPFSCDMELTESGFEASGATANTFPTLADRVYVWNGTGYDIYFLRTGDGWRAASAPTTPTNVVIPMGEGFWYRAKNGGFTWSETNVYLGNL